jgi:hypothetical protein
MNRVPIVPPRAATGEKTISQDALEMAKSGRISFQQAGKIVAHHTADTLADHRPMKFLPQPQQLQTYCAQRERGLLPRDPVLAVKNGEWLDSINKASAINRKEVEHLLWAREICLECKSSAQAERIETHLHQFAQLSFPREQFLTALEVQRRDSDDKRKDLKGGQ